jgi:hypothetical protein
VRRSARRAVGLRYNWRHSLDRRKRNLPLKLRGVRAAFQMAMAGNRCRRMFLFGAAYGLTVQIMDVDFAYARNSATHLWERPSAVLLKFFRPLDLLEHSVASSGVPLKWQTLRVQVLYHPRQKVFFSWSMAIKEGIPVACLARLLTLYLSVRHSLFDGQWVQCGLVSH